MTHPENELVTGTKKIVEARTAVLLVNRYSNASQNMWFLEHMFRPLNIGKYGEFELLYLSSNVKPSWEKKRKDRPLQIEPQLRTKSSTVSNESISHNANTSVLEAKVKDQAYIITARTRTLKIAKDHCFVFMIDMSSSLATIETSNGSILIGNSFHVVANILQGLVKPFALFLSDTSPPISIDHTIRVTIIAECSQFGSNINVIPILAEYPTMRVLMQNVQVSANNIYGVLRGLKEGLDTFERDLGIARKKLILKRLKMGYELDVRDNHAQSIADSTESRFAPVETSSASIGSARNIHSRKASTPSMSASNSTTHRQYKQSPKKSITSNSSTKAISSTTTAAASINDTENRSHTHHKSLSSTSSNNRARDANNPTRSKDTWGVGKTGSTLSYILRAALFALDLLPKNGQPSIILLTDGVVKSSIQDESVIQEMVAKNIACNVVQLGKDMNFFPGLNFGFVPDNEILEFVSSATNGVFTFSEYCTSIADEDGDNDLPMPNIYHYRYLLRDIILDSKSLRSGKTKENRNDTINNPEDSPTSTIKNISTRLNNANLSVNNMNILIPHFDRKAFPWDPMAKPITEDSGRLKFKEYFLPSECWHFVHARLRQGFILHSMSFVDEMKPSSSKSSNMINKQLSSEALFITQKKQNILIVLILRWQPNITIHYSIRSLWTSSLHTYLNSVSSLYNKMMDIPEEPINIDDQSMFSHMRAPKVDIIIKSTSTFSHMLHNWESFQRRNQMMAVQGSNMTIDLTGAPGLIKVGKMKRLLERIAESDIMLKQLVQFNFSDKHNTALLPHHAVSSDMADWATQLSYVQKFSVHWAKLERSDLRIFNMCWYDERSFNLIIGVEHCSSTSEGLQQAFDDDSNETQPDIDQIHKRLAEWATFMSEDQQVYIKILNLDKVSETISSHDNSKKASPGYPNNGTPKRHIVPQFCEVRVLKETERLVQIRVMFFNATANICEDITQELQSLFDTQLQYQNALLNLEIKDPSSNINSSAIQNNGDQYADSSISIRLTRRPISSLLMRDSTHFLLFNSGETQTSKSAMVEKKPLLYTNPSLSLTGEFIVKNYLNRCTWHWDIQDLCQEKNSNSTCSTPLIELAFNLIMSTRAGQEWSLLSSNKSFGHFYKEVSSGYESDSVYSCQYFVWKDDSKKRISTELWCEPTVSSDTVSKLYSDLQINVYNEDKQILSQLITFDVMYNFATKLFASVSDALATHMEIEDEMRGSVKWIQRAAMFNIPSIIRKSKLLFAVYSCPKFNQHYHPKTYPDKFQEYNTVSYPNHPEQKEHEPPNTESSSTALPLLRGRRNNMSTSTNPTPGSRSRTISKFSPIGSPLTSSLKTPPSWQTKRSTECTCPRPDKLFADEKDSISKLRSVFRDVALLHYYFEQSLTTIADRNISLNKSSSDDFWHEFVNRLFDFKDLSANKSSMYAAQSFRDLRCLIKVFDPSMFIVMFIPRLDAVVKSLSKLDRNTRMENDAFCFESIGLTMFECRRQTDQTQQDCTFQITLMNPLSHKEWYDSLSNTLRPNLAYGLSSASSALSDRVLRMVQDVTQVYSRSFVKSIFTCLLHGRAVSSEDFEKVSEICDDYNIDISLTEYLNVQTLLKHRSRTSKEELIQANQRFISVLGHYFEPVVISNSKWDNVYCYRPPFAKTGQKLGLSLSSGEKPNNLTDVVVYAQNPLFVRLECSLKRPHESGVGFECVTFPVKSLPSLYSWQTNDGVLHDFEPKSIGTASSPVESADGTIATLHLVCMSLPRSEYDPPDTMLSHQATCPAESSVHHQTTFLDIDKSSRFRLSSLSQDKQEALIETEARLNWLFTEEIMHGLLRSGPITQNVVRYVEAQLKKKNSFVDFPTTTSIPLAFVKHQKESRRMFFEELEKHSNTLYRLIRAGDCFYAYDIGASNNLSKNNEDLGLDDDSKSEYNSLFDGEGLNITTEPNAEVSDKGLYENEEQENDEFCQGLGISILESELSGDANNHSGKDEIIESQLYWLLLIPQAQSVQIYFYSKMQQFVDRSEIIRVTKSMVNDTISKTNKLSLLQSLNDTRICSKYLLASIEEDESLYSSCDESSEEENSPYNAMASNNNLVEILSTSGEENVLTPTKKFLPGQFSCDVVYLKRFPLHWRISPNAAYNKLMTDTLPPFLVRNKPGMFVCSHGDSVLYFFLYESSTSMQQHVSALSEQMSQPSSNNLNAHDENYIPINPDSPYGTSVINSNIHDSDILGNSQSTRTRHSSYIHNKPSPQGSTASQQISPSHSPSINDTGISASSPIGGRRHSARHHESRELVLEVHGVKVDYYIVDGLVDMIDSRITSEITLKEVQQFLVRNPGSRLSRADINFILPVEKEPSFRHKLRVPSIIKNTVHFLKILRKNILTEASIHPIHSGYAPLFVKRHHEMRYSTFEELEHNKVLNENVQRLPSEDWLLTDLLFYYNYMNRAPGTYIPFEQRIGEGVAGICLSMLDRNDTAYSKITSGYSGLSSNGQHYHTNLSSIKECLTSDFEDVSLDSKLTIGIDMWSCCKIELAYIYQHIHKAFKQSVCDYIIENAISNSIHFSRHQQEVADFDRLTKTLLYTLDTAAEWQSSITRKISYNIQLTPSYFENILTQLKAELIEIHPSLDPIVARAEIGVPVFTNEIQKQAPKYTLSLEGTENLNLFQEKNESNLSSQPSRLTSKANKKKAATPNINHQYLILSGIPELYSRYIAPPLQGIRRGSIDLLEASSLNPKPLARNFMHFGGGTNINPIGEEDINLAYHANELQKRDDNASLHSRQESLASSVSKAFPNYALKQKLHSSEQKDASHQHSFVVFVLDSLKLSIYTYNCSEQFSEYICSSACRIVLQQETRHMGLNNILHQKLGLFHHTSSMSDIVSRFHCDSDFFPSFTHNSTNNVAMLQHNIISHVQNTSNINSRSSASPSLANTIGRLTQTESVSSIPTVNSMERRSSNSNNNTKQAVLQADFESLQNLVRDTVEQKSRIAFIRSYRTSSMFNASEKTLSQAIPDVLDNQKSSAMARSTSDPAYMPSQLINADKVLRDTYSESIEYNRGGLSTDHLSNHGKPYLDSLLAQSKPLAAHEKAFKVYTKWAEHCCKSGHAPTADEMMTIDELKQILKASRLLHFCRTPLIFSESSFALESLDLNPKKPQSSQKTDTNQEITIWYEQMARDFMKEYASYLESIGMQLIVYGPSNGREDEAAAYVSRFTVSESYSVNSPVVYLLQVFEGGSIMCEVRLTGVFVSVTLYTLHRQYGRLNRYPYFYREQSNVERERFQSFTSECDRFKQRIHVNSFVFDFQIRQIQRSLDNIDSLPSNLHLLNIINNIASLYDQPAIYSRNRIISGTYAFPSTEEPIQGFVSWMMNHGEAFGMKILKANKVPVSLFVSSDDLSFDNENYHPNDKEVPFTYTLLVCPKEQTYLTKKKNGDGVYRQGSFDLSGSNSIFSFARNSIGTEMDATDHPSNLYLQYFILVTYRIDDCLNSGHQDPKLWSEALKENTKHNRFSSNQKLVPELHTLNDVYISARSKLNEIMKKVLHLYQREVDWNRLYEAIRFVSSKATSEEIVQLAQKFNPLDLITIDPVFSEIFQLKGIDWDNILDNLKIFYKMTTGDIQINDVRHVLLFVPSLAHPIFFHFIRTPNGGCKATINSKKQPISARELDESERKSITTLATTLTFNIWRHMI